MSAGPHALDLLEQAAWTAIRSIDGADGIDPRTPTPCTRWDLGTLVRHVADSAAATRELVTRIPPAAAPPPPGCAAARHELRGLLDAIGQAPRERPDIELAALVGAFELTIHAWDISQATAGANLPGLPAGLVTELLSLAPVVLGIDRAGLFASEVPPSDCRSDTDRLLALFGRLP
ncbi:MAG TPA: maleylpyruvate isomerase N-terminal domain-containing protein [Trebonia sp.]